MAIPSTRPTAGSGSAFASLALAVLLAVLALLPTVFVTWAWVRSGGLPYFKDANETFLSFVHARGLSRFNPSQTFFLTVEDTRNESGTPGNMYVHNPNLPRYVHYLLLLAGVSSLPLQILIITALATLATMAVLLLLCRSLAPGTAAVWIALPLVFVFDSMGFLSWAVNTYRVLSFVLLWGTVAAVVRPAPPWILFIASFLLLHYEYAFAVFAFAAAAAFAVAIHGRAAGRVILWLSLGAAASVALFAAQVFAYLGPVAAWNELLRTAGGRGARMPIMELVSYIPGTLRNYYHPAQLALVGWSLVTAPLVLVLAGRLSGEAAARPHWGFRVGLARLQLSLLFGCVVVAFVLQDYFVKAMVGNFIPCLVFLFAVGAATGALDIAGMIGVALRRLGRPATALARTLGYGAAVGLVLLNFSHVFDLYPPWRGEFVNLLQTRYRGEPFVAPLGLHILAHALTWGSSAASPLAVTAAELPSYENLRSSDGQLYYFCVMNPRLHDYCNTAASAMAAEGHQVVDRGEDFVIVRLASDPRLTGGGP